MMYRRLLTCLSITYCIVSQGQDKCIVVADIESRRPLRDVIIYLNTGENVTTNWTGRFVYTGKKFSSATIAHPEYLSRIMNAEEMNGDTIFLLPKYNQLAEVVVYGHQNKKNYYTPFSKTDAQLMQAQPQGFNLLGLVATGIKSLFKGGTSEKQKEKTKRMLDKY